MPRIINLGDLDWSPDWPGEFPDWPTLVIQPDNWDTVRMSLKCPTVNIVEDAVLDAHKLVTQALRESITSTERVKGLVKALFSTKGESVANAGLICCEDLILNRETGEVLLYTKEKMFEHDSLEKYYHPMFVELIKLLDKSTRVYFFGFCSSLGNDAILIALGDGIKIQKPARFVSALARKMSRLWKEINAVPA